MRGSRKDEYRKDRRLYGETHTGESPSSHPKGKEGTRRRKRVKREGERGKEADGVTQSRRKRASSHTPE